MSAEEIRDDNRSLSVAGRLLGCWSGEVVGGARFWLFWMDRESA